MPHRDPHTGQFLPDGESMEAFDRFEEVYDRVELSVPAADIGGQTGQDFGQDGSLEGEVFYGMDEGLLDRDEIAVMLWAEHHLIAGILSTQTADGTVRATVEISGSPEPSAATRRLAAVQLSDAPDTSGDFTIERASPGPQVTGDLVGRPLEALGYGPFSDGATGVGGAGTAGTDDWQGSMAANPVFDDRDDLFYHATLEHSNVADAALFAALSARHVYGVIQD